MITVIIVDMEVKWIVKVLKGSGGYMTEKRVDGIDKLTAFELNVLKLLHCIATMKRGHTYEQIVYLTLLEQLFFPETEDLE